MLVLVEEAAMLQLHYGLLTSLVVALLQKKIFKNGLVRLDQIFPSSFHEEQHIVPVEERYVKHYFPVNSPYTIKACACFSFLLLNRNQNMCHCISEEGITMTQSRRQTKN